jgi:hypothetical protein
MSVVSPVEMLVLASAPAFKSLSTMARLRFSQASASAVTW